MLYARPRSVCSPCPPSTRSSRSSCRASTKRPPVGALLERLLATRDPEGGRRRREPQLGPHAPSSNRTDVTLVSRIARAARQRGAPQQLGRRPGVQHQQLRRPLSSHPVGGGPRHGVVGFPESAWRRVTLTSPVFARTLEHGQRTTDINTMFKAPCSTEISFACDAACVGVVQASEAPSRPSRCPSYAARGSRTGRNGPSRRTPSRRTGQSSSTGSRSRVAVVTIPTRTQRSPGARARTSSSAGSCLALMWLGAGSTIPSKLLPRSTVSFQIAGVFPARGRRTVHRLPRGSLALQRAEQ